MAEKEVKVQYPKDKVLSWATSVSKKYLCLIMIDRGSVLLSLVKYKK